MTFEREKHAEHIAVQHLAHAIIRPIARIRFSLYKWLWQSSVRIGPTVTISTDDKVTVILLSFRRMQNIAPISKAVLKCDFVEKLIVCNNNPDIDINDWVRVHDPRIALFNESVRRRAGHRWVLAQREPAEYFLVLDDDVLIYPIQLKNLFLHLVAEPGIPHGISGTRNSIFARRQETEVDTLHQAFAVTKTHVDRFFRLASLLSSYRIDASDSVGDDIIISKTGSGNPKIHDLGRMLLCRTSRRKGVAVYLEDGAKERRTAVAREIAALKGVSAH